MNFNWMVVTLLPGQWPVLPWDKFFFVWNLWKAGFCPACLFPFGASCGASWSFVCLFVDLFFWCIEHIVFFTLGGLCRLSYFTGFLVPSTSLRPRTALRCPPTPKLLEVLCKEGSKAWHSEDGVSNFKLAHIPHYILSRTTGFEWEGVLGHYSSSIGPSKCPI